MILIKKKYIFFFTLISAFSVFALGFYFYDIINLTNLSKDIKTKFYSEQFIFIAILLIMLIVFSSFKILKKSRNIFEELDKIIELLNVGNYNFESRIKGFGKFGSKLFEIFSRLVKLNSMKTEKIKAQTALLNNVLEFTSKRIIITDIRGVIINCNELTAEFLGIPKNQIKTLKIETLISDIQLNLIILELNKTRESLNKENNVIIKNAEKKIKISFTGVFNSDDKIEYIIITF